MSQLQEIKVTLDEAKAKVRLMEDLEKLERNPSFRRLIKEGLLRDNVLTMATLTSSPHEQLAVPAMNAVKAKGVIEAYFGNIFREGEAAKASITELEAAHQAELGAKE